MQIAFMQKKTEYDKQQNKIFFSHNGMYGGVGELPQ